MNPARVSRLGHRWLALLLGLQLAIWALSGLYMVAMDIDFIHGDSLVRNLNPHFDPGRDAVRLSEVRRGRDDIHEITFRALPDDGQRVVEIARAGAWQLMDAGSGAMLSPLPAERIRSIARAYYAGRGSILRTTLIATDADMPTEVRGRPAPVWRIDFDDWLETSLYVHPDTGRLVTRRHRFWRWYDFLWSLHIMDYREREDFNNWLVRPATVLAAATAVFGIWVAFFSFRFLQRRRSPKGLR